MTSPLHISALLDRAATLHPDRVAVVGPPGTPPLSYAEVSAQANALAAFLSRREIAWPCSA